MADLHKPYDAPAAFKALWATVDQMFAIVGTIDNKDFDWVVAAQLIKASRDRLAPFAEPHFPGLSYVDPDKTSASIEWIYATALRIVRKAAPLIDDVKRNAETASPTKLSEYRRRLLKQIILATIDLHDLTYSPNIRDALLPEPRFSRDMGPPNPSDDLN
ncbi:MAG: hypothetical protein U9Q03_06150 [Patescibacteria group bacterium]|nr:hypothetical protein [Patescibacteria group bacterium]